MAAPLPNDKARENGDGPAAIIRKRRRRTGTCGDHAGLSQGPWTCN